MAQSAEIRGFGGNILEGLRALLRIDCDYPLPLLTAEQFSTFAESLTLDVKYLSSRMFADPTAPEQLVRWTLSSFWSCAVWNIPMSIASPVPEADLQDLIDSFADAILSSWAEAESWRSYPSAQVNLEGPSPSHIVPGDTLSTLLVFKPDTISVRRRFILACMIFLVYQMRSQGQRWDASPWVGTRCGWSCLYVGRKLLTILPQLRYSSAEMRSFQVVLARHEESSRELISPPQLSWVPSPRLLLLNRGFDLACHMFARTEFCRGLGDVPMLWCRNALLHWLQTGTLPNGAYPFDPTPHSPFGEILHYPRRPRESVRGIQEFIGRWNTMITSRFSLFPDNHPAPIAVNGDSTAFSALRILHTLANMVWIIVFSLGDDSRCLADIEDTTCLVAQLLLRWEEEHTCNAVFQLIRSSLEAIYPHIIDIQLPGKPYHLVEMLLRAPAEQVLEAVDEREAQMLLNILQESLDCGAFANQPLLIHSARSLLLNISQSTGALPDTFKISDIRVEGDKVNPIALGGFADIFRGTREPPRTCKVALKRLQFAMSSTSTLKAFYKEAIVWRQLDHPNVLPFLGVDLKTFPEWPSLVMPWVEAGSLLDYISNIHPTGHRLMELANVLINDMGLPCLADFGLAVFVEEAHGGSSNELAEGNFDNHSAALSTYQGTLRWLAPEVLDANTPHREWRRKPSRDVYAFGSLCLEIISGLHPYSDITSDVAVLLFILEHKRPPRPVLRQSWKGIVDTYLWGVMERCWDENPANRPTSEALLFLVEPYFKAHALSLEASPIIQGFPYFFEEMDEEMDEEE